MNAIYVRHITTGDNAQMTNYEMYLPGIEGFAESYSNTIAAIDRANVFIYSTTNFIESNKGILAQKEMQLKDSVSLCGQLYHSVESNFAKVQSEVEDLATTYTQLTNNNSAKLDALPSKYVIQMDEYAKPVNALPALLESAKKDYFDKSTELSQTISDYQIHNNESAEIKYNIYYIRFLIACKNYNISINNFCEVCYNGVFAYKKAMDFAFNLINIKEKQ